MNNLIAPERVTHVLYHANCADGFGAAYAAWKVLGDQAEYLPVRHGQPPPDLPDWGQVAVVDFSYPREILIELKSRVAGLMILDHHKSALQDLESLDYARFDLTKAGARMAWEFWHPDSQLPSLLAYIEDRDLWRWALPHSREISQALHSYPMGKREDFALWDSLDVEDLQREGQAILRYQNLQVQRAVSRARWISLADHKIPAVNSCLFQSEIGEELCQRYPEAPFSAVWYTKDENQAWSLRSVGDFDVSLVAQIFGGGGHRNAAGFARPDQLDSPVAE